MAAAFTGSSTLLSCQCLAPTRVSGLKMVSFSNTGRTNLPLSFRRLQISCAAKPETVDKVCNIVRKQLALKEDMSVSGESKFAALGADSLDTVEIVMGLEEEFGITVEEESAQNIATVQDAADLIEKILEKGSA
ncbi:putative Acyl carrier protein (ACP) [Helianthus debilis subsp. tardiflorus]